ncbi:MAG TPA: hypothetical protein VFX27_03295 [Sphingobium sp.]|nr:hypothetical protein [Sphingobium sp.]
MAVAGDAKGCEVNRSAGGLRQNGGLGFASEDQQGNPDQRCAHCGVAAQARQAGNKNFQHISRVAWSIIGVLLRKT